MNKLKQVILLCISLVIILSFTACGSIDKVKELMFKEDPDIKFIRSDQDDITASVQTNLRETVIYYEDDNDHLVPIKREIAWQEGIGKAVLKSMVDSVAIREEIGKIGFKPVIPKQTEILGMTVDEDTKLCKVDFSSHILNYDTKSQEKNIVKAIVYTLTEFPNIETVQILIDGEIKKDLKHGTSIEKPLKREDINLIDVSETILDGGYSKILVYYKAINEEKYDYYVPITIPVSAPNAGPEQVVKKLFEGTQADLAGLYTDIPNGVELEGVSVENGTLTLSLSSKEKDTLKNQEVIDRMSKNIGLSLNQFADIDKIKLSANGKVLQDTVPVFANEY